MTCASRDFIQRCVICENELCDMDAKLEEKSNEMGIRSELGVKL